MTLPAGTLRHRIRIEQFVLDVDSNGDVVQDPATGATRGQWVEFATTFAAIEPLSAKEFIAAQATQSKISARIVIRYRTGLDASMRFIHMVNNKRQALYDPHGFLADKDSGLEYLTIPVSTGVIDDDEQPSNLIPPSISGDTVEDSTLTASPGVWSSGSVFDYQWNRDGVPITGATSQTLLLVTDDIGAMITVTVSVSNAGGVASSTSAPVGPVTPTPYVMLRDAAIAAAVANNAALWFVGNEQDMATAVFSGSGGTGAVSPGGTVGYWRDWSGGGHNAVNVTSGERPVLAVTSNGYGALDFSNKNLNQDVFFAQASDHTVIAKASGLVAGAGRLTAFGTGRNSFDRYPQLAFNPDSMQIQAVYVSDAGIQQLSAAIVDAVNPPVATLRKTGTTTILRVGGSTANTGTITAGTDAMTGSQLGAYVSMAEPMNGRIHLVCAGPVSMSDADMEAIEAFANLLAS